MFYFLAAVVCAAVGVLPLLIARKFVGAVAQGIISFLVLWATFYLTVPSTVWPLFGGPGFCVFIIWFIDAVILIVSDDDSASVGILPASLAVVLYIGSSFIGSEFMRTGDYYGMLGAMETREWTQDVQPKDPKHMRMSTKNNAIYLAQKAIGQDGSIGSQFQVEDEEFTLQMVNGELWYIAPLEFKGYAAWNSTKSSPGYIKVSAENPDLQPQLVNFPQGQVMQYSPSAFFGHELERHLRNNGYLNKGLTGFNFEVDESHKAWWVVTVFEPTIMWGAEKTLGVVIVDPATGATTFHPLGQVPDWVDRVVPGEYVKNYLTWYGKYGSGWWNSVWAERNITEPGDISLIYGEGGQPEWVTDVTSNNGKDNSLIGLVYTNSRTGKSVSYKVPGGGTNAAVLNAVDNNPQINYKKLRGADPQLYNVYGTMASVVPLFNESHSFQGVAIVPIENVQEVAYGTNQYEALRAYEKIMTGGGQKVALGKDRVIERKEGVVDRVNSETTGTGNTYYIHLPGVPHLFTGGSNDSPKLPVTKEGDRVRIEYYASERDVVPISSFDNLSLVLTESRDQKEVRQTVTNERGHQEAKEDARTTREKLNNLTPEELQELGKHLPKKQ
jgi:hypothetical protein